MHFNWVGHACVLITYKNTKLITDPWFGLPFHFNTFHAYPPFTAPSQEVLDTIDVIHISHMHQDHFCKRSLSLFKKEITIAIAAYKNKFFLNELKSLGFNNIIEIPEGPDGIKIKDINFRTLITPEEKNYDSVLIVSAKSEKIEGEDLFLLNNDCYISQEQFDNFQKYFKSIKGCFLGYSPINPYPSCYDLSKMVNHEKITMMSRIEKEQLSLLNYILNICKQFKTKWMVPYASNLRFLNSDLFHHNRLFTELELFDSIGFPSQVLKKIQIGSTINNLGDVILANKPDIATLEDLKHLPYFKDIDDELILIYKDNIILKIQDFLNKVSQSWTKPFKILINILGKETSFEIQYCFPQDNINKSIDLVVNYKFSDMKRLCDGEFTFIQLHYMYRFEAVVLNYVPKQSAVHLWR